MSPLTRRDALSVALGSTVLGQRAAQVDPRVLKRELDGIAGTLRGTAGYSLLIRSPWRAHLTLRGDEAFPAASTMKVAVAVQVMRQVSAGKLAWNRRLAARRAPGGPGAQLVSGAALTVPQWLHLMIGMSDNTATKTLVAAVGKESVNRWLETRGFAKTRLQMGSSGYGSTTPNEMVRLFDLIRTGKAASPAACDRLLRMLSHQYWDDRIASQVPPTVRVFSKSGSISRARSDVALVVAPNVEYILAVFTREQADASWRRQNEGMELIRRLSAHTWRRLNPRDPWRPPDGYEVLLPPNGP